MSNDSHSLTHLGGEHHQGGEPQSLDRASEPPASRIASDTGKAHAYAEGKLNGAGPGAGEKGGASSATAASDEGRGNTAGSGYVEGGPAPGIA
ncbi:cellulose-binding, family II [Rhodotorula diobovata]|uniref:Cellulose-binding, family II n=1 Tax=Rhodotorula diobovata TaxID=5288 RepID=A0A5C5FVR9_9BASI|nr:cellulose-binding, family II [Rhodotorula diobovata]